MSPSISRALFPPMPELSEFNAWPPGTSPFSGRVRRLVNELSFHVSWVDANREDLTALLAKPDPVFGGGAPRVRLPVISITATLIKGSFHRWSYSWASTIVDPLDFTRLVVNPDSETAILSSDEGWAEAYNLMEQNNVEIIGPPIVRLVNNGVDVTDTAEFEFTIGPIPNGTPVILDVLPFIVTDPGPPIVGFHPVFFNLPIPVNGDCVS